ncbi:MAG: flagellar basal body L-ring protein FlgH [Candidatus Auribacter fodinae]|uniref:Flagellar L-ring protein n=1 Tax=Candidatus Auribacter fodinae TaxID=2093366 RepID=A0A3A4RGE7_9BACT|nr:MAG: flagellar basal body L-ring protein FlgH [Candidatus Auribacter fodinae]
MRNVFSVMLLIALFIVASKGYADSLWHQSYSGQSLFTDDKAAQIGDIITIVIKETTSAKRSSETSTSKDVSNKGSITSWLYPQTASKGVLAHNGELPAWEYDTEKDFTGKGAITEQDTLTAEISAKVIEVYPNGNLLIQGSRIISVANDKKKIIISGIVRRSDVTPENTIDSNLISDAQIYYEGKGPIADNQRRGVFTWLRDMFSLF